MDQMVVSTSGGDQGPAGRVRPRFQDPERFKLAMEAKWDFMYITYVIILSINVLLLCQSSMKLECANVPSMFNVGYNFQTSFIVSNTLVYVIYIVR